jgi:membrane fusion protein (multidrug efflux system)
MSEARDRSLPAPGEPAARRLPPGLAPTARTAPMTEPTAAPPPAPAAGAALARVRRRWLRPLLFLLLPLALLWGGWQYVAGGQVMSTENAYVRADIVAVSTDISGIVKEIDVQENSAVRAGDALFSFDDLPFRLALQRAQAQVGIVTASLEAQKASYRDMQAQIRQAQVDTDFYAKEQDRQAKLVGSGASSVVTLEQAQRNLQSARQKVASLDQQLAGIVASLAGDPNIEVAKHPRTLEALAQRDEAARQLAHTVVRAPMAGIVTNVPSLQPGQYLAAAGAAFSIVAADHMWVEAEPKETELTWVHPGQAAVIAVDTYPDQEWHGAVESISPASASSFSMLPAQNTSGNWVKVVQRIPMRVRIDTPPGKPPLRASMSVVVGIDTGHARGLPSFLAGLFGQRHA